MTGFSLGAGFFRRSGTGAEAHKASGHQSGKAQQSSGSREHDGTPLGDQSGPRAGAGQAGEGSNRSERD